MRMRHLKKGPDTAVLGPTGDKLLHLVLHCVETTGVCYMLLRKGPHCLHLLALELVRDPHLSHPHCLAGGQYPGINILISEDAMTLQRSQYPQML